MTQVDVRAAQAQLSRLLAPAQRGEQIVITRRGQPVVRLMPIAKPSGRRRLGTLRGKVRIAPDFDAPLPPELLTTFEASS
jgi:prevent-host-death family protein